jgi:tape measure domain-containing protein
MSAIELATAYISLVPSTDKIAPAIKSELGKVSKSSETSGGQIGDGLLSGIGKTLKFGAIAIGAGVVGGIGTALVKGFSRLSSLDQANAKLTGLGHSAETVKGIMDNALASVKGTAFGMDEAATTAAGAVAAGIQPGKDLERVLKLTADAATIAGTDMGSMGSIFNKVAASGKLQGDVIAQLQDAGVPILQMVAKQMGVTAGEAADMASEGKVSFETFTAAMQDGLGGAALKSGDTFSGTMDNMGASLGRVGANLLSGIFPQMKDGLTGLTGFLSGVEGGAKGVGSAIGAILKLVVGGKFSTEFRTAFNVEEDAPMVGFILDMRQGVIDLFKTLSSIGSGAFSWIGNNLELIKNLAIGFGIAAVALTLYSTTVKVVSAVTKAWAVVQGILNGTMALNPIGLIVVAIVALVAAIIWVATQTTFFQDAWAVMVDIFTNSVGMFSDFANNTIGMFGDFFTNTVGMFSDFFSNTMGMFGDFFTAVYAGVIKPVIDGIAAVFTWLYNNIIFPIITGIMLYIGLWALIIQWLWESAISPALGAIGALFTWLYAAVIQPVFAAIGAVFVWVYETIIKPIFDGIAAAINIVGGVIGTVLGFIASVWNATWSGIGSFFGMIWGAIVGYVTMYINTVLSIITTVGAVISGIWNGIWGGISSFFSGVWGGIVAAVQSFGGFFKSAFDGIAGFVSKAFAGVVGAVKGPINAIIGIVNGAIGALNSVSVTIPAWVPIVGGQTFGLHLPRIPQLANGGIVQAKNGGTLANIGEGRYDEAVVPLTPQFMAALEGGGSSGEAQPIYVQNPWTGEYLLAKTDQRVHSALTETMTSKEAGFRR